jgi:IS30 family transposase
MKTPERRRKAVKLHAAGLSQRAIATKLGVSQPTVGRDLRDAAQEARLHVATPVYKASRSMLRLVAGQHGRRNRLLRQALATRLYHDGCSLREIGRQLGISPATVMRDMRDRAERRLVEERGREAVRALGEDMLRRKLGRQPAPQPAPPRLTLLPDQPE